MKKRLQKSVTQLFLIAPLQWEETVFADYDDWKQTNWTARTPFGSYSVVRDQNEDKVSFRWEYFYNDLDEGTAPCADVDDGKAKALAHWLNRLMPALVKAS